MNNITPQKVLTHQEQREAIKANRKIKDMNTGKILGFLVHRHRLALSLTFNVALVAFYVSKLA